MKLGILGSTRGTNMLAIIDAIASKHLSAVISVVISNKQDALILENARRNGLVAHFVDPTGLSRSEYDATVSALLEKYQVDLVVLIGYMRILSPMFVNTWKDKVINVHPSLLPAHAGKMDLAVHEAVLAAGEKETGCTVHQVTEVVDAGPIVIQKRCEVFSSDEPHTLKARVQALEGAALIEAIQQLSNRVADSEGSVSG